MHTGNLYFPRGCSLENEGVYLCMHFYYYHLKNVNYQFIVKYQRTAFFLVFLISFAGTEACHLLFGGLGLGLGFAVFINNSWYNSLKYFSVPHNLTGKANTFLL